MGVFKELHDPWDDVMERRGFDFFLREIVKEKATGTSGTGDVKVEKEDKPPSP